MNTETYKKKLEDEKEMLNRELSGMGHKVGKDDWAADTPEHDDSDEDKTSTANEVEEFETRVGTLSELEVRLDQVIQALERISAGTYGHCTKGDEKHEIESERLDANPAATTCITHMEN